MSWLSRLAIGFACEAAPVVRRGDTDDAPEVVAQQCRVPEARTFGHPVYLQIAFLEQAPRVQHALVGHPLHGRGAGLIDEAAGEGARRHARPARQRGHGVWLLDVLQNPIKLGGKTFRASHRNRVVDVLTLTPVPLRRHHHPPGDHVGDRTAEFAAHEVQAGVDAGGGACAGDQVSVIDEQHIAVHPGRRIRAGPGRQRASSVWCTPARPAGRPRRRRTPPSTRSG